ncbi:MAG TPA: aminotransferase class I/II-fold pyridoxal phosphate-dependent enzyme [Alphaproteobacteria bacterium]|nr:aminotransferase class I/II-fold pyridoxal phosphate-dependent enzyme [Alphaproteobacteria bacterium]
MGDRLEPLLAYHPFTRLNALLGELRTPQGVSVLNLAVGEPQFSAPPMVREVLEREAAGWSRYPPSAGTPEFRTAIAEWLGRRYRLPPGMIDPDRNILPAPGTREALFQLGLSAVALKGNGAPPKVLIPNPFYHVYAGAAAAAGAETVFVSAGPDTGFLPDFEALPAALLDRTALAFLSTPANPQGAVADLARLEGLLSLARRHGFVLAVDECYAEIYDRAPPPGALEAAARLGGRLDNLVVLHSLSKRSSVPGLRSGFIAGPAELIRRSLQLVNHGGAGVPLPVLAASAALWRDEAHVAENRARYRRNMDIAERILGNSLGFRRPAGGFFLWLEVGDSETAARRLWAEAGLRVLPGQYMGRVDQTGRHPGRPYIRVALVHEPETVADAMTRLAETLAPQAKAEEQG